MQFDQFPRDVQAEPQPTAPSAVSHHVELVKDALLICVWDAGTAVRNAHTERLIPFCHAHADLPSLWSELDGVGKDVGQDLRDAPAVHLNRLYGLGQVQVHGVALAIRQWA